MTNPRARLALRAPQQRLAGFPPYRVERRRVLHRAHQAGRSPWWFASALDGRFDLPDPHGTCYLAFDDATALRERLGPSLSAAAAVPASLLERVVVSRLRLPHRARVADAAHKDATRFGVTREINTTARYRLTQRWAAAWHAAGFAGVRYEARFSTALHALSLALFGTAGQAPWACDPDPVPASDVAAAAGIRVPPRPRPAAITWAAPPL